MSMSRAERRRAEKLSRQKGNIASGFNNNMALMERAAKDMKAGRFKPAIISLEKILKAQPERHNIRLAAAGAFVNLGDYKKASEHYQHVVEAEPDNVKAHYGLALCLKSLGEFRQASEAARRSTELSGDAVEPLQIYIELLWALGETAEIPALCRKLLIHKPHRTDIAMFEGMAYYHQGEREKGRAVFAFDDLVEVHDLETPPGYSDMTSFNKALADYIVDHPSMAVPDKNHPTYHNDQLNITRELIGSNATGDAGPVAVLQEMIEEKIADYLKRRRGTLDHAFIARWPEKSRLTAWGTLLRGEGNLLSHIHLDGYLGMVYYPELPPEMRSDAANSGKDKSGFLQLGDTPDDFPVKVEPDSYTIQPKEGRLIMFPGCFFHRTIPFHSEHRRISIAFDVIAETE